VTFDVVDRFPAPTVERAAGSQVAPLPGAVVAVHVGLGDQVAADQPLLVIEAMKMQHVVCAPHAGTVTELPIRTGETVDVGAVLAVLAVVAVPTSTPDPGTTQEQP
jgi:propionyl-CoA carboxylase alpha chain